MKVLLPVAVAVMALVTQGTLIDGGSARRATVLRASGGGLDRKVTNEYVAATRMYLLAIDDSMRSIHNAIGNESRVIGSGCPKVAVNAPMNTSRARVDRAIVEALTITAAHAETVIVTHWRTRVGILHWTNPRLTGIVQRSAHAASTETTLKKPSLCESLKLWARSDFQTVPLGLGEFSRKAEAISEAVNLLPNALARYEGGATRKLVREVRSLRLAVGRGLRVRIMSARREILNAIGLRHATTSGPESSHPIQIAGGAT
jgi:hypothetical protein